MLNPNLVAMLFFTWMLTYWLINSFGSFIDIKWTGMKFDPDSLNKANNFRLIVYLAVGGVLFILGVVAWWV